MAKQADLDRAYMKSAFAMAELSYAQRKKVGCIVVAPDGGIIAEGVNGTPSGFNNNCEYEGPSGNLVTKQEVLHAESNAFAKIALSTNSSRGATLYTTYSPCFDCAKLIIQMGVERVVYAELYKTDRGAVKDEGIKLLERAGVICENCVV